MNQSFDGIYSNKISIFYEIFMGDSLNLIIDSFSVELFFLKIL